MKRITAIVLCLIFAFVLSGCGQKKKEVQTFEAKIYFLDENSEFCAERRQLPVEGREKAVVEEVIKGPENPALTKPVQGDVKVLSATMSDNGVCTVDLSKEFVEENTGGSFKESLAIYAIVNSLCEIDIEYVKINIEGDEAYEFGGHYDMSMPFPYEPNMIRIEDRNN